MRSTADSPSENKETTTLIVEKNVAGILKWRTSSSHLLKDKAKILDDITKKTENYYSGWTHTQQKRYLETALTDIKGNDLFNKVWKDEKIKSVLLDLMLCGKYLLRVKKEKNHQYEKDYTSEFKKNLAILENQFQLTNELIQACVEIPALHILPLAYYEILAHDEMLEPFRISEFFGHNIAYKIAKNKEYKTLIIKDKKSGTELESFDIQQIDAISEGKKDLGLMGAILIPKNTQEKIPTIYVTWAGTHSKATGKADLERTAGEESYRKAEDQILKQISDVISKFGKSVKIVICGHSLGGALSQLFFHSLQRILALNLKGNEIAKDIKDWEETFQIALKKESIKLTDIEKCNLSPNLICEMELGVWNSAGILKPVSNHSNQLSKILINAGIPQSASFAFVGGDIVGPTGQGNILDDLHEKGAKISVLKLEPPTTRALTTTIGSMGAFPAALTFFGTGVGGVLAGAALTTAVVGKTLLNKKEAHTNHYFTETERPEIPYSIYKSHDETQTCNQEDCKKIQEELRNKSLIIDMGSLNISKIRR